MFSTVSWSLFDSTEKEKDKKDVPLVNTAWSLMIT